MIFSRVTSKTRPFHVDICSEKFKGMTTVLRLVIRCIWERKALLYCFPFQITSWQRSSCHPWQTAQVWSGVHTWKQIHISGYESVLFKCWVWKQPSHDYWCALPHSSIALFSLSEPQSLSLCRCNLRYLKEVASLMLSALLPVLHFSWFGWRAQKPWHL